MRNASLALVLVAVAAVGCASSSDSASPSEPGQAASSASAASGLPIVGTWILQTVDGVSVSALMDKSLRSPSLTIQNDGTLNGFSGVNNFHGSLSPADLANGTFDPGPMAMTMMAGPPDAMDVETRFMQDLNASTGFVVQGDTLNLTEGGMTLLTFARGS